MLIKYLNHPLFKKGITFSGLSYVFRIFNNLLLFSFLARIYSEGDFGVLSFVILLTKIIQTTVDFGHRISVVKDLSTDRKLFTSGYFMSKIGMKVILGFLTFIPLLIYAYYNDFWGGGLSIAVSIFVIGLTGSIVNFYFSIFQGFEKFHLETKSLAVITGLSIIVIYLSSVYKSISWFLIPYALIHVVQLLYTSRLLLKVKTINLSLRNVNLSLSSFKREFIVALPFAIIVLFDISFSSFDSFFVEAYFSPTDLGYFEAIKKIVIGLNVFGIVVSVALMPTLTRWAQNITTISLKYILTSFLLIAVIATGIFFTYFIFNHEVIALLLGEKYSVLTTWDIHIGLFVLSSYLRIVPSLYLVGSDRNYMRIGVVVLSFVVGLLTFVFWLNYADIKHAVKLSAYTNVFMTAVSIIAFLYYLFVDFRSQKISNGKIV